MNILLHTCCAPCAISPVEELKKEGHKFAAFFYNPNIHLYSEYLKRKGEVEKHAKKESFNIIPPRTTQLRLVLDQDMSGNGVQLLEIRNIQVPPDTGSERGRNNFFVDSIKIHFHLLRTLKFREKLSTEIITYIFTGRPFPANS